MNLIEAIFELFGAIFKGVFSLLSVLIGGYDYAKPREKYSAKFMGLWTRLKLLSRFNRGICVNGKQNITEKMSCEHVLYVGGSGSGKTSNFLPEVFKTKNSFVLMDVDGNGFDVTSGWKSKTHKIKTFDVANPEKSARINPVTSCQNDQDLQKLAGDILQISGLGNGGGEAGFWALGAKSVLFITLRILKTQEVKYQNLANARHLLQRFHQSENFIAENATAAVWNDYLAYSGADFKVRAGYVSTALASLEWLSDPTLAYLTSGDSLSYNDLAQKTEGWYLIVPEVKLNHTKNMLSLLFVQLFEHLQTNKPKKRLNLYLDEFAQLTIPDFSLLATTMRRYQISMTLLIQDMKQLSAKYGSDGASAIWNGSCATKVILPGMSLELAEMISRSVGRKSLSLDHKDPLKLTDRELLTAQELIQLPKKKALFLYRNERPHIMKMRPYYKQFFLRKKAKMQPVGRKRNEVKPPELLPLNASPSLNPNQS